MAYNFTNINDYYALEKAIVPARYLLTWAGDFVRAVENFAADEDDEDAQNSVKAIVSAGAWNAGELINEVAKFKLEEATAAAKEIGCFVLTTSAMVNEICEEVQKTNASRGLKSQTIISISPRNSLSRSLKS